MNIFTIDRETNTITLHSTPEEAEAAREADHFMDEIGLARLVVDWPAVRLVEIWNSLPGETPVKKFKDRTTAIKRIWNAMQKLLGRVPEGHSREESEPMPQAISIPDTTQEPAVPGAYEGIAENSEPLGLASPRAPHAPDVAPLEPAAAARAIRVKKPPKADARVKISRQRSKSETILDLLQRPGGATLKEIMKATGWQAHSVRGFLSGTVGKKMNLRVISGKAEGGERSYSIQA